MNIRVHIESLVVDDRLKMNARALEAAVIDAVSKAALMHPGLQRGRSIDRQDFADDWTGQLGRAFQTSVGSALDGVARPFDTLQRSESS